VNNEKTILKNEKIDIPLVITIGLMEDDIKGRIDAGPDILNVSGAD
jgi:hypothetical protein